MKKIVFVLFVICFFTTILAFAQNKNVDIITLESVDVYHGDGKVNQDIVIDMVKFEMIIMGKKIAYPPVVNHVIKGVLHGQDKGGRQPYVYVDDINKTPTIIRMGDHPIGGSPKKI